jgi:vitamin B12/bleomycin/antimicrobial peptide transport system ATP-binding/permease protein
MQAAQAFQRVTSALSWPVDNLGEIARCRASAARVLGLYNDLQAPGRAARDGSRIAREGRGERPCLVLTRSASPILPATRSSTCLPRSAAGSACWSPAIRRPPRHSSRPSAACGPGAAAASCCRGTRPSPSCPSDRCCPRERCAKPWPIRPADAFSDAAAPACARVRRHGLARAAPRRARTWERVLPLRARQRLASPACCCNGRGGSSWRKPATPSTPDGERLVLEMLQQALPDTTLITISFHPGLEAAAPPDARGPARRRRRH